MEPLVYAAIFKMVTEKSIDKEVIKSQRSVDLWKKRLAMFTIKKDKLMWRSKVVPTIEDMEQVLRPIDRNQRKKHCIDVRKLKAVMQDKDFIMPHFTEGLERACLL